jgi:PKD repeat protein
MTSFPRRVRGPALALTLLTFAAAAGAQMPLSFLPGDAAIVAAAGDQTAPYAERGGDLVLVAWGDRRAYPPDASRFFDFETSSDIYAMRLDANGQPLETVPFPVTQARAAQSEPKVSWNGTHWLVVYESVDLGGTGFYYETTLEAVRVAPSGEVVDETSIKIRNVTPTGSDWDVTSNGTDWVVVFQSSAATTALQALRITADGVVEQPSTVIVPATYFMRSNIDVEYADGVYLLTWADFSDTMAIRFDDDFVPLDPTPQMLVDGAVLSDLAASPTQFYAVWHRQQPDFTFAVAGSRISTAGVKLDGNGVNISGTSQPEFQSEQSTSVDWDGTNFRVGWGSAGVLRLGRVSPAGAVLDPNGVAVPGPRAGIVTATANGGVQVTWENLSDQFQYDILSANVSAANVAGPTIPLSSGAPQQTRADVAVGSNGYMVVYRSDVSGLTRILAQPLDLAGNPTTAEPVVLTQGDVTHGLGYPTVAWNGQTYLATWPDTIGIIGRRIDQDGTLPDPQTLQMFPGFGPVDVAALGNLFLVIAHQFGGNEHTVVPVVARVRGSDGVVLDPQGRKIGGSFARSVAVTRLGNRWLAVWQQNVTHDNPVASTNGAFVSPNGTSTPQFTIYGPYSTSSGSSDFEVAVAASPASALVLQSDEITSNVETDLVGRIVNADGTLRPAVTLTPWRGNQYRPRVAWDGRQFVVVYNDQKNRFAYLELDQFDSRSDLYGIRVRANGTRVDPEGFAFSASPLAEANPNVAGIGGTALLVGSIMRNDGLDAYRIGYARYGAGGNAWPVAVARSDTTGGDIPLTVSFSSAGSTDPDGTLVALEWDFGDGTASTEPNPIHTYAVPGEYVARLTVTDDDGVTTLDTEAIGVSAPNVQPVAVAHATPASGPAPLEVVLTAEGSYDVDGSLGNFEWTFSDGGSYWGSTAYHTFSTPGTHTATLTVYDGRGGSGSDTITVEVEPPNALPVVVISATPTNGDAPLTVAFSSTGTHDPDGTIASWLWSFGDGATSTARNPTHVYTSAGTYTAKLTVTDNRGGQASKTVQIKVTGDCFVKCARSTDIELTGRDNGGGTVRITGKVFVKNENGQPLGQAQVTIQWTKPTGQKSTYVTNANDQGVAAYTISGPSGTWTLDVKSIAYPGHTFDPNHSVLSESITF